MIRDPIHRTILNMIRYRGGESTLVYRTEGVYDPATSTVASTEEAFAIKTLVFEARESYAPNSLIRTGDQQMFVQADADLPAFDAANSSVIHNGKTYQIVWLKALNPSGKKVLMYELFVRG